MQRESIVTGAHEPTDEQCEWPSDEEEDEDGEMAKQTEQLKIEDATADGEKEISFHDSL